MVIIPTLLSNTGQWTGPCPASDTGYTILYLTLQSALCHVILMQNSR